MLLRFWLNIQLCVFLHSRCLPVILCVFSIKEKKISSAVHKCCLLWWVDCHEVDLLFSGFSIAFFGRSLPPLILCPLAVYRGSISTCRTSGSDQRGQPVSHTSVEGARERRRPAHQALHSWASRGQASGLGQGGHSAWWHHHLRGWSPDGGKQLCVPRLCGERWGHEPTSGVRYSCDLQESSR